MTKYYFPRLIVLTTLVCTLCSSAFSQTQTYNSKIIKESHMETIEMQKELGSGSKKFDGYKYDVTCGDGTAASFKYDNYLNSIVHYDSTGRHTRYSFGRNSYFVEMPNDDPPTLIAANKSIGIPFCMSKLNIYAKWIGGNEAGSGYEVHCDNGKTSFFPAASTKSDYINSLPKSSLPPDGGLLETMNEFVGRPFCYQDVIGYSLIHHNPAAGKSSPEYHVYCVDHRETVFHRNKFGYLVTITYPNKTLTQPIDESDLGKLDHQIGKLFCGKILKQAN